MAEFTGKTSGTNQRKVKNAILICQSGFLFPPAEGFPGFADRGCSSVQCLWRESPDARNRSGSRCGKARKPFVFRIVAANRLRPFRPPKRPAGTVFRRKRFASSRFLATAERNALEPDLTTWRGVGKFNEIFPFVFCFRLRPELSFPLSLTLQFPSVVKLS